MTNFSSKNTVDLIASIETILQRGMEAANRQNWSVVNKNLQQLPLSQNKKELLLPTTSARQTAFKLATQVLLEGDFQQQWEVAKILPLLGKSIIEPSIALLKDSTVDIEARWFICGILGKFPERRVILALVELLQQTEIEELAIAASQTLTQIGTKAIDALVELLRSPQRTLAVKSLAYIRRPEIIDPLITVVEDPQPEIRAIVIEALGSFHDERVPLLLLTALKDTSSLVRKEAINALGFRPDLCEKLDLVAHLQPLLYDFNLEVCSRAAIALGRMKNEMAVKTLFASLNSATTPVSLKLDLLRALAWSETKLAVECLHQALVDNYTDTNSELILQEIVSVLGRITASELKPIASEALINFWRERGQNSSPELRQILANSLGELKQVKAATVLEELIDDEHKIVRLHAIAALKKLSK